MATTTKGPQRKGTNRAPRNTARPASATVTAASMTAVEAAPAIDPAHDATIIPAATLVPAAEMTIPSVVPAMPSPDPDTPDTDTGFAPDPGTAPVVDETPTAPVPTGTITPTLTTEDSIMDMNTTIENARNATEQMTDKGSAMFADVSERTKGAVEKSQKLLAELAEFNKGTLEAMVESSKIAARGLETMSQDAAAYAKTSFEGATQAMKTLATVKSPAEFMKLQADYARTAFDALVAQTSRSTETSLKLAGEVAQPISNRVALAADKIKVVA